MFSGIVEEMATLVALRNDKENVDFTLTCSFTNELKIDQSVSHNGVCLTVVMDSRSRLRMCRQLLVSASWQREAAGSSEHQGGKHRGHRGFPACNAFRRLVCCEGG